MGRSSSVAAPGPVQQVSTSGGANPAWNPNGHELFFMAPDPSGAPERDPIFVRTIETSDRPPVDRHVLMAVCFAPGPSLRIGEPRALFAFDDADVKRRVYALALLRRRARWAAVLRHADVAAAVRGAGHAHQPHPNWPDELKAKVPATR